MNMRDKKARLVSQELKQKLLEKLKLYLSRRTDERRKSRGGTCSDYALQGGGRR